MSRDGDQALAAFVSEAREQDYEHFGFAWIVDRTRF